MLSPPLQDTADAAVNFVCLQGVAAENEAAFREPGMIPVRVPARHTIWRPLLASPETLSGSEEVERRLQTVHRTWESKPVKLLPAVLLLLTSPLLAGNAPPSPDPFKAVAFLEGTWEATTGDTAGIHVVGTYTFKPELGGHVLARHVTSLTACKGPDTFDCEHSDLLYVFVEAPGQPLKAIHFDNEGHVIHYNVSTPDATTAVFFSDTSQPGPQFRLTYELKNSVMSGRFQMHMPGQAEWRSYLEWSGGRK